MSKVARNLFSLLEYLDELENLNNLIEMCVEQIDFCSERRDDRIALLLELHKQQFKCICDEVKSLTYRTYKEARSESVEFSQQPVKGSQQ